MFSWKVLDLFTKAVSVSLQPSLTLFQADRYHLRFRKGTELRLM